MKRVMCGKMTMAYQNAQIGKSPGNVVYRVRPKGGGQQCSDGSPRTANNFMVPASNVHSQPHQSDPTAAAAWNILAVSMYIRSQSPDSSSCLPLPPLPPSPPPVTALNSPPTTTTSTPNAALTSPSMSSDAVDNLSLSSSCCTSASSSSSSLYSGQSTGGGGAPDHETRSSSSLWSSEEGGKAGSHLSLKGSESIRTSFGESCSTDSSSSDEEKFSDTYFEQQPFYGRQNGGSGGAGGGAGMPAVSAGDRLVQSSGAHQDLPPESPPMFSFTHKFQGNYARPNPNGVGGGLEMSSSSSSSIGGCEDSSCSSGEASNEASEDMEVESPHRGGPLHHMDALEASLPIKRGLSRFWNGKAKSFTSLTDVLSIEQLAKPDNPYARRKRSNTSDRHKSFPPRSRLSTAGISKRPTATSGRNGLAVAVAMGSQLEEAPKHHHHDDHHDDHHYPSASPPASSLSSSRSLSLTDLVQSTSKGA